MSGEYFGGDVDDSNILEEKPFEDNKIGNWSHRTGGSHKGSERGDEKLFDMSDVLEIAENRCTTLREELDSMKTTYRDKSCVQDSTDCKRDSVLMDKRGMMRQNSGAIGTDNTGAAVVTINNILSGITNSINRLSELHASGDTARSHSRPRGSRENRVKSSMEILEEDHRVVSSGYSFGNTSSMMTNVKHQDHKRHTKRRSIASLDSSGSMIQVRSRSKRKESMRSTHRIKDDSGRGESAGSIKKQKKRIKRLNQLSKTSVMRKNRPFTKEVPHASNHLVELYHNAAAKSSESDDNIDDHQPSYKAKMSHVEVKPKSKKVQNVQLPALEDVKEEVVCYTNARHDNRSLSPIDERMDVGDTCNDPDYSTFSHNYETPTIASRMKQVARGYFRSTNIKTIPFCAAKSTSPSHNIGINIQQVMSIIKTRQPIKGISPTLAHNIGLAAEKLNHRSLSAMVSSLGSRIGYRYLPCPMLRNSLNYQQLQEMAKEIPEGEEEIDDGKEDGKHEDDLEKPPEQTTWAVDASSMQMNCTCIPDKGVGFQQVLNKYQLYPTPMTTSGSQNQYAQKILKRSQQRYKHIRSVYAQCNDSLNKKKYMVEDNVLEQASDGSLTVKGKEKILKGVLVNLHDEFRQLNEKYDNLSKIVSSTADTDVNVDHVKELEWLEKKLNDKEEEIQMVMSLYTEVVTLKQQVKVLKEKASMASVIVEQQKQQYQMAYQKQWQYQQQQQFQQGQMKIRGQQKSAQAAVHLTKMLRQIQAYQDVNKTGGK